MILTVTPNPCLHQIVTFPGARPERTVIRPVRARFQGGGKGINAARAARVCGAEVTALFTAGGEIGRLLERGVREEGIEAEAVWVRERTRVSTFLHGDQGGFFHEFLEEGQDPCADEVERFRRRYLTLLGRADLVLLCGSLPGPAFAGFYPFAIAAARERGVPVAVDTYGAAAAAAAAAAPSLLKANLHEVEASFQVPLDSAAALEGLMKRLAGQGVEKVLLTAGARGAWLFEDDEILHVSAPGVAEVNPVGSGDAMLGAIAAEWVQGEGLARSVRLGAGAGAANAARLGVCDFGRDEAEALAGQVQVRPIRGTDPSPIRLA